MSKNKERTNYSYLPSILSIALILCLGFCPSGSYAKLQQVGGDGPMETPPLKCWSGTSNPKASTGYPPEQVECSLVGGGSVCEMTYVANLHLYSMSCTTDVSCQLKLSDLDSGSITSLYDEVRCCNESLCNADPNMPSSGSTMDALKPMVMLTSCIVISHFIGNI